MANANERLISLSEGDAEVILRFHNNEYGTASGISGSEQRDIDEAHVNKLIQELMIYHFGVTQEEIWLRILLLADSMLNRYYPTPE